MNENLKTNAENIEKNTSLTDNQKNEQIESVRKKHNEELRSLLTTEQRAKLKIRTKNQPNRKGRTPRKAGL